MAAALSSLVPPWRDRLSPLLAALGEHYVHLIHVGVGWAMARAPVARRWFGRRLDPLLAPLALDGHGFHDGFFRHRAVLKGWRAVKGRQQPFYDQGIGRSLWFSGGAEPERVAAAVSTFAPARQLDLWAGIGLAAVYAGGADADRLDRLTACAASARRWLGQGSAFAITALARAGDIPEAAAEAALRITGISSPALVSLVADAEAEARRADLPWFDRYQTWRTGIATAIEKGDAT